MSSSVTLSLFFKRLKNYERDISDFIFSIVEINKFKKKWKNIDDINCRLICHHREIISKFSVEKNCYIFKMRCSLSMPYTYVIEKKDNIWIFSEISSGLLISKAEGGNIPSLKKLTRSSYNHSALQALVYIREKLNN